jgi:phosphotransferase system HPr (HPr) family protein
MVGRVTQHCKRTIEIASAHGLHFRPAQLLVALASRFEADVRLYANDLEADAKVFLSVVALAVEKGTALTIEARGPDAERAMAAIIELIESDFDETAAQSNADAV